VAAARTLQERSRSESHATKPAIRAPTEAIPYAGGVRDSEEWNAVTEVCEKRKLLRNEGAQRGRARCGRFSGTPSLVRWFERPPREVEHAQRRAAYVSAGGCGSRPGEPLRCLPSTVAGSPTEWEAQESRDRRSEGSDRAAFYLGGGADVPSACIAVRAVCRW